MCSDDGQVVLTYNGEVYNFRELRRELESLGRKFRSSGDTEVVLRSFEEWGTDAVRRLDGMFAVAVWDGRRQELVLARDRSGKKPLYYSVADERLTFGSEIKAVVAAPWVPWEPALERVGEYLTFGYVPHPATLLRGVEQVPPGAIVRFGRSGLSDPERYWDPAGAPPLRRADGSFEGTLRSAFQLAVSRRMIADVPLGALLSGGVDSSLVVAAMTREAVGPVHTFSIGFSGHSSFDERNWAQLVSDHFGTRHTVFEVRPEAAALLDELLWYHDQPFGDSSAIPTFLVSQLASEHVTVVLNGDGGDEVFGGYDRFTAAKLARFIPGGLARVGSKVAGVLPDDGGYFALRRRARRFLDAAGAPALDAYHSWSAVTPAPLVHDWVRPEFCAEHLDASVRDCYERVPDLPTLDRLLYANFRTYLPDDLAVKMDRMSMAHSLEARSPFLDTAVCELLANVRASEKVGIRQVKPLLRNAFEPMLPDAIWDRRKHGFGVPMNDWFRGELGELFADEVLDRSARTADVFDKQAMCRAFDDHRKNRAQHGYRFWAALTLERWLRLGRPASAPPRSVTAVGG